MLSNTYCLRLWFLCPLCRYIYWIYLQIT